MATAGAAQLPRVYFPNLNALRFVAAALVIVHHVEQYRDLLGLPNAWHNPFVHQIGRLGVVLFFVLSGFLITYLLRKERTSTGSIDVRSFYIRRVLRIWPLYFLILGLALLVLPWVQAFTLPGIGREVVWAHLPLKVALSVFFLPNLMVWLYGVIPYLSQTWSIGAEEQFYLFWPVLNKWAKRTWVVVLGVLAAYLALKFGSILAAETTPNRYTVGLRNLLATAPFDCMAIGAGFALLVDAERGRSLRLRDLLYHPVLQWVVLLGTVLLLGFGVVVPYVHDDVYALLFGVLILNFAANPQRIFSMENRLTNYLGKVSYGLYMYHAICIMMAIRLLQWGGVLHPALLYPLAFALSIGVAALSYEYFEARLLRFKGRFSHVVSGNEAKAGTDAPVVPAVVPHAA